MRRFNLILFAVIFCFITSYSRDWSLDSLCRGFENTTVTLPDDYTGRERCVVVRMQSRCQQVSRGVLYVHGFNDYFFQDWMGREFADSCYDFYAVDLRRYGRALMPGQRRCDVRDMRDYFIDIDSALNVMRQSGVKDITLMGHSTGGLILSYYVAAERPAGVNALVLNSPFLDWNLSGFQEKLLIPMVTCIGRGLNRINIPQGDSEAYAASLLKSRHGEWEYDTILKTPRSPDVTSGWIRAVTLAQRYLRSHPYSIDVPILLLHSDRSVYGSEWSEEHNHGDGVLDVNDIHRYGMTLGYDVTEDVIPGALHDIMLSAPAVRRRAINDIFRWLDNKVYIR